MRYRTGTALAAALLLGALPASAESDPDMSARHVAAAEAAAGQQLAHVLGHCEKIGKPFTIPHDKGHEMLKRLVGKGDVRSTAIFDNLVFLGTSWTTTWAIPTSDGIILIDALNNEDEAERFIEGGLREVGLDPADIKKIVVSHAHGDHYGGAAYLKEKYSAEIIMSDTDWQELEKDELQFDDPLWGRPPERDVSVADGDTVTLGDTTITLLETPGHTPGTLSTIVPLTDDGTAHKAIIWGGNGLNFGPNAAQFVQMIDSQRRLAAMAGEEGFDVFLSNHKTLDATYTKLDAMESGADGNPFVIGADQVERTFTAMSHCVAAQLASFDPEAVPTH
ncbi:metallo-beta-lactamase class B [Palleronia aestuarii]|uniref:Metallo-beta-lactamase class B n=1 Tax=Palleronia aestuarii TaxID=568105 RepID=A0A2W7ND28_9RHOB|nr:MBL fold metallo-hydrolase [Palleronia aestuarii]PZX10986.1 metallo-beta-lactamase class B [Palleronia aestuarii]